MAFYSTNLSEVNTLSNSISFFLQIEGDVNGPKSQYELKLHHKAILKLIDSIDIKHLCNGDRELFKYTLKSILDKIGELIKYEFYDDIDGSNMKNLRLFTRE